MTTTPTKTSPTKTATTKKRPRRTWLWFGLGLLVLILLSLFFFRDRLPALAGSRNSEVVETVTLTPQPYTITVTGPGKLSPLQSRDLAPEVTGIVASVVAKGERVTSGQTLVQLDTGSFERSVRDAQVALEQAQAQRESSASSKADSNTTLQESIANAQRSISSAERDAQTKLTDLELKQRLVTVGSESNEAVRTAQNDYDTAVAALEQAQLSLQTLQESQTYRSSSNQQDLRNADLAINASQLSLERAQEDLAKTTIVAPFVGVVSDVSIKQGSPVTTATTLLTLIDDTQMELEAQIDETQISQVVLGQAANVTLDALPGQTFEGRVTEIAPAARLEQNIPIFDVTVLLDNTEGKLRSGMSAEAAIIVGEVEATVSVPTRAVQTTDNQATVQVQQSNGTSASQNVRVIATEGFNSVLGTDLSAGTKVIIPPAQTATVIGGPLDGAQ
jgi:HlyD family secretion protein